MKSAALAIGGCILGAAVVISWHAMTPAEPDRDGLPYFDHTDVDPDKAAYYEAIWRAMFDR